MAGAGIMVGAGIISVIIPILEITLLLIEVSEQLGPIDWGFHVAQLLRLEGIPHYLDQDLPLEQQKHAIREGQIASEVDHTTVEDQVLTIVAPIQGFVQVIQAHQEDLAVYAVLPVDRHAVVECALPAVEVLEVAVYVQVPAGVVEVLGQGLQVEVVDRLVVEVNQRIL